MEANFYQINSQYRRRVLHKTEFLLKKKKDNPSLWCSGAKTTI